jgi:hypothetical protein
MKSEAWIKPDYENQKEGPHIDFLQPLDFGFTTGVEKTRVNLNGEVINGQTNIDGGHKFKWKSTS